MRSQGAYWRAYTECAPRGYPVYPKHLQTGVNEQGGGGKSPKPNSIFFDGRPIGQKYGNKIKRSFWIVGVIVVFLWLSIGSKWLINAWGWMPILFLTFWEFPNLDQIWNLGPLIID